MLGERFVFVASAPTVWSFVFVFVVCLLLMLRVGWAESRLVRIVGIVG